MDELYERKRRETGMVNQYPRQGSVGEHTIAGDQPAPQRRLSVRLRSAAAASTAGRHIILHGWRKFVSPGARASHSQQYESPMTRMDTAESLSCAAASHRKRTAGGCVSQTGMLRLAGGQRQSGAVRLAATSPRARQPGCPIPSSFRRSCGPWGSPAGV